MKKALIWIASVVITLSAVVFQRMTGPTRPVRETITLNENPCKIKLARSFETGKTPLVKIPVSDENTSGTVYYRVYRSNEDFRVDTLKRSDEGLLAELPELESAGKIEYQVVLTGKDTNVLYASPFVVARFKDPVPAMWLVPHILLTFIAMLLAMVAGLMAVFKVGTYPKILFWCGIALLLGGFVFGMPVQKFAFGEYWTGIPFGWDLTDNKTLFAMLIVAFAIFRNRREPSRRWTIIAALSIILVYSIPHSTLGSERDPNSGEITQTR